MPRHSPYALLCLNFSLCSAIYCLSFANNYFTMKKLSFQMLLFWFFRRSISAPLACCSFPLFIGKTFLSQKIFLNIQLSVSFLFLYSVFNDHLLVTTSAFARHYFRNLVWFLFLRLLRCFSSAGSLPYTMYSCTDPWFFTMGVSPFGDLRVNVYFQLTAAYRRLSRPSSALGAKAFILCSFSLEQLRFFVLSWTSLLLAMSFANNCFWVV